MKEMLVLALYKIKLFLLPVVAFADSSYKSNVTQGQWKSQKNTAADKAAQIVVDMIASLLVIFRYAGILVLTYGIITFIFAMKDENADAKVNAISKMSVGIVCFTLSTTIQLLLTSMGSSAELPS